MHKWIAGAALAWNALGLLLFVVRATLSDAQIAAMPPQDRAMVDGTPAWVLLAFGVAVVAGVAGSIGLLLSRRWAVPALLTSLVALIAQVAGTFLATPAWQAYGPAGLVMPAVLLTIAVLLLRYARRATA